MKVDSLLNKIFPSVNKFHRDIAVNRNCEEFEVDNWSLSSFVVEKLLPVVGTRPFPLNELMLMSAAVCHIRPRYIFEWGTHIGKSARVFHEASKAFAVHARIHSVDLPAAAGHCEHPGAEHGRMVRGLHDVQLHFGDGLQVALDIQARQPADDFTTLFFVDGDHEYASVRRELHGIRRQVPGASILVHDTFNQSARSGYNIGPHRAVLEFLREAEGAYRVIEQNLGLPGMTLLWRRSDIQVTQTCHLAAEQR